MMRMPRWRPGRFLFPATVLVWPLLLMLAACGSSAGPVSVSGKVNGNTWSVTVAEPPADLTRQALQRVVESVLSNVRSQTSGSDSALQRFNTAASEQWVAVPPEFATLVQHTLALGRAAVGAYDVTRRSLLKLWGVGGLSQPARPPAPAELARVRERTGVGLVTVRKDPPALRKAVDGVGLYLADILPAYRAHLVSGRLQALGAENWRIRFGNTLLINAKTGRQAFTVPLPASDGSVRVASDSHIAIASAAAPADRIVLGRRRYASIIDPRTGRPVAHEGQSVTVIAENAIRAGAMARALLVMGPRAGLRFANARGIAARFEYDAAAGEAEPLHSRAFKSYLAGE